MSNSPPRQSPAQLLKDPGHFCAFGFGSGLIPMAPGTWGTLVGVVVYYPFSALPLAAYLPLTIILFGIGVWLCNRTACALGVHDDGRIVWDEIVGFLITMMFLPTNGIAIFVGFALFRVFDILKPWPIGWLDQRIHGGFGIMLDDVIAGVFAGLCGLLIYSTGFVG